MVTRVEGTDLSRIQAFTDGVFAIAITLLVLALDVPQTDSELGDGLVDQLPNLGAYFLSFAVIGRLWIVHHRFFATLCRFDGLLMSLNLLYLSFVVLVPFTTELLGDHADDTIAAVVYAVVLGLASITNFMMIRHAVNAGHVEEAQREITAPFGRKEALLMPGIFFASIPIAFIDPHVAEIMWIGLLFRPRRLKL